MQFDIVIKRGVTERIERNDKRGTIEVFAWTYTRAKNMIREYMAKR